MNAIEKKINRNRKVVVQRRDRIGVETKYEFYEPDGSPVMESAYEAVVYSDWRKETMTYEQLCCTLGFDPDCRFVDVTDSGTIFGTFGKPEEFRALRAAVDSNGFRRKYQK